MPAASSSAVPCGDPRRRAAAQACIGFYIASTLVGCGPPGGGDRADALPIDALPRVLPMEDLRLGSRDDVHVGFARINTRFPAADVDADGNLYIYDALEMRIRVYDAAGREVRRIGGQGAGPGEFQGPAGIGVRGDTLWAFESTFAAQRITLFSRHDGRVLATGRIEPVLAPLTGRQFAPVVPIAMGQDGHFLSGTWGIRNVPEAEPSTAQRNDTLLIPRIRFARTGEVVDTIGFEPRFPPLTPSWEVIQIGDDLYRKPVRPSYEPIVVPTHDGYIQVERPVATGAHTGVARVTRIRFPHDTLYSHPLGYRPVEYGVLLDSIAARESLNRASVTASGAVGVSASPVGSGPDSLEVRRALRAAMDFPRFQAPIQRAWLGNDGVLWLRREDTGEAALRWLLADPDGVPFREVELPRSAQPLWHRGDVLLTVDHDDLGVPWIVRYRLQD